MNDPAIIVIPLHHRGGKFRTDLELRFALRSLAANFVGEFKVVIIGKKKPAWLTGVEFIQPARGGLKHALVVAARAYPSGFFWYYDDCVLLQPTTAAEMQLTPASKVWGKPTRTRWGRMLEKVHRRLKMEGHSTYNYSRPHGPYFFDKPMVDESFADWPGMKGKFPFESWILNKRDWPRRHAAVRQYYGGFKSPPGPSRRYLNYNDGGNTLELREWLRKQFPKESRFETDEEVSKEEMYYLQSRHIYNAWDQQGRPELRTICECAVGPHSLLVRFKGLAERTVLIEPDPDMARKARRRYPWAELMEVAVTEQYGTVNLRRLEGSSYVKGLPWAPAFDRFPRRARAAGKVAVAGVPFTAIDDGRIDLINLDCEGGEWYVLQGMTSRPLILQIELYEKHGHYREIIAWIRENGYQEMARWGNANIIYRRV
jgi:FkbM family methyltransferase